MLNINILTLMPEDFKGFLSSHIVKRAIKNQTANVQVIDIKQFVKGSFRKIDDSPYGGGAGMILRYEPIVKAINALKHSETFTILMSPSGQTYNQAMARKIAHTYDNIIMICGHYEGVDQRILDHWDMEEISVGNFVLTGGELPAMMLVDAVARMVPGVLKSDASASEESIYSGLLEHPQYTRPRSYEDQEVPAVLLSGDHEKIRLWRLEQSLRLTKERRPDLFRAFIAKADQLSKKEKKILEKVGL